MNANVSMDTASLGLVGAASGLAAKEFSSVELTQAYLGRIEAIDGRVHAYLTVDAEGALAAARAADERRRAGEAGPLLGVPLAIKDNLMTVGIRTTAASKILEHYDPSYDATVVRKLRDAGAVILGKTNLDEWGHGASTENSAFGPTRNPWDAERVAGGSSGGSAAAVAAGLSAAALGTDTGGSTRYPAGFCGVVGLRPSYGRVSRSGLLSMTSSSDTVGQLGRSVRDVAELLDVTAGPDPRDQTTHPTPPPPRAYTAALEARGDLTGLTIGVPSGFVGSEGVTAGVKKSFAAALETMRALGAKVADVALPHAGYGIAVYYIITPSEISANLARFDGIRYGYRAPGAEDLYDVYAKSRGRGLGPEAKRRIMLGTYALSAGYYDAYYLTAQRVRTLITRELEETLGAVDVIATPTAPHVASKVGEKVGDPLAMYLEDIFMSPAALAGLPALSVPCGFAEPEEVRISSNFSSELASEKGRLGSDLPNRGGDASPGQALPVGLQLVGRRFDEGTLLAVGHVFEQATPWHERRPALAR